ncbi:MAG: class I SAM-dependent methyltransferase [Rubripirellula sp.]
MSQDASAGRPTVDQFFDALTDEYAMVIERCFPRYREMLWALIDYLPPGFQPQRILELGSGTGNLSVLLAERFPEAEIDFVDIASESLDACRARLNEQSRFRFHPNDFRRLDFPAGHFDLVTSSIAIHHLTSVEKQSLFAKIHGWLSSDGVFAYADQHSGATDDLNARHIANWKAISKLAGSTDEEWEMWMQHQADHDFHDSLTDQLRWVSEAGFAVVDCPWRYLLWTVVQARKGA